MKNLNTLRINILIDKNYKIILLIIYLFSGNLVIAQELPENQIYGHVRLFFNDLLIVGNHKILWAKDKRHESKRYMYLLDETNQVKDTMKCSAIEDIITLNDSTFIIWDLNYEVEILIRHDRFIVKKVYLILSSFENLFGLSIILDPKYMIGEKYLTKQDCDVFNAAIISDVSFPVILKTPDRYERSLYNLSSKDTIITITLKCPRDINLSPEQKNTFERELKKFKIEPFTFLNEKYTCNRRTRVYYGWDNVEIYGNKMYLYEKNSCSVYAFDLNHDLTMQDAFILPVNNRTTESWKYFFDWNSGEHYAVKRVVVYSADKSKSGKSEMKYEYNIYRLDWKDKDLKFISKSMSEPIYVSKRNIYLLNISKKSIDITAVRIEEN